MILYFSATGNSAYVANTVGNDLQDETLNLLNKLQQHDYSEITSNTPWVIVAPTYAWQIPHFLYDWLMKTELSGNKQVYFVLTCGENIGNAGSYLKKLCIKKGLTYAGCMPIVMPDNYILMFNTPTHNQSIKIIDQAEDSIHEVTHIIKNEYHIDIHASIKDKLSSGFVNKCFYPIMVHAKKFYATDACIACGKCETLCPLNNINVTSKPEWGRNCTHCMACIQLCPVKAIEYGKKTIGKERYHCPK